MKRLSQLLVILSIGVLLTACPDKDKDKGSSGRRGITPAERNSRNLGYQGNCQRDFGYRDYRSNNNSRYRDYRNNFNSRFRGNSTQTCTDSFGVPLNPEFCGCNIGGIRGQNLLRFGYAGNYSQANSFFLRFQLGNGYPLYNPTFGYYNWISFSAIAQSNARYGNPAFYPGTRALIQCNPLNPGICPGRCVPQGSYNYGICY